MAPRTFWKGYLKLSLVTCPVTLMPATTEGEKVRFHTLNADTGKFQWHYQETPGDNWDYTSTQPMILADVAIDGAPRKVILHAPKNGFFFVIDRTNGKFISAKNFVDVNWATGYDASGRPIEVAAART